MGSVTKRLLLIAQPTALIASSTAAVASSPAPPPSAPSSWMMLSMLSPSGTVALGGADAAAQPQSDGPLPAPAATDDAHGGIPTPPLPVIALWLAVIGVDIWLVTRNDHHVRIPNSPA